APTKARIQAAPRQPATVSPRCHRSRPLTTATATGVSPSSPAFHGECFVPDEYRKLGSFAFVGLPSAAYPILFVAPGEESPCYAVIIGGANFGCGSSMSTAPGLRAGNGRCGRGLHPHLLPQFRGLWWVVEVCHLI
ncbi:hypothetical protein ZWY2020_025253, partial [Hordeum vulgare]